MKRIVALVIVLSILTLSGSTFATYKDLPKDADYTEAVERVTSLGLIEDTGNNSFSPNQAVTREEFARLIVIAGGLSDEAEIMMGRAVYSDVPADNKYNGYINVCVDKGYMASLADGKFRPEDPVTYAQAVTGMIRVLSYSDADISGVWPRNYLDKARALGLTDGISLSTDGGVPRWAMAQMVDALLDTKVKQPSGEQAAAKTLAEASELTSATMYSEYSRPQVYYKSALKNKKLGTIDLSGKLSIVKNSVNNNTDPAVVINGESIKAKDIEDYNVVYEVSDKSGANKYVLVIDNQITGSITGILPNKFTPLSIQVDSKEYELDSSFNINKLSGSDSLVLDDAVTLLLGREGKVVDIERATFEDNSDFAFVMNYSVENYTVASTNKTSNERLRYVKLLLTNRAVKTFETNTNASSMKGKVVKYIIEDDGTVKLTLPTYDTSLPMTIDKGNRRILYGTKTYSNDVTGNVKIFSLVSDAEDSEADAQADLVSWSQMPSGTLPSGKVIYFNRSGIFEDINVIFVNNIKTDEYSLGYIRSCEKVEVPGEEDKEYRYTITVNGKNAVYTCDYHINVDTVVMVSMSGNSITDIIAETVPDTKATTIQALNQDRIRVNQRTYTLSEDINIYKIDESGDFKVVKLTQLWNKASGTIYLYTDTGFQLGGEVELIVIEEDD